MNRAASRWSSIVLLLMGSAVMAQAAAVSPPPAAALGFKGKIDGTVAKADKENKVLVLKVSQVTAGDGSTATDAQALVGQEVAIGLQHGKDAAGKLVPDADQMDLLGRLTVGQAVQVSAQTWQGKHLIFAGFPATHELAPEAAAGFVGEVEGTLQFVDPQQSWFVIKLTKVTAGEKSKAEKPEALTGLSIRVGARYTKNPSGQSVPSKQDCEFIGKLKKGDTLACGIATYTPAKNRFALTSYAGSVGKDQLQPTDPWPPKQP